MAWADVAAFTENQVVDADDLNQLADNIEYLANPNQETAFLGSGPELTTTSTSWVSVSASLEKTITTTGRPLLVLLQGSVRVTGSGSEIGHFDIEIDGSRIGHSTEGIVSVGRETNAGSVVTTPPYFASIGAIITGLSAASHTVKIMWIVDSGGTLRLGYGAAAIRLWVREL